MRKKKILKQLENYAKELAELNKEKTQITNELLLIQHTQSVKKGAKVSLN